MVDSASPPAAPSLDGLLKELTALKGTDLYLLGGSPPVVNVAGDYRRLSGSPLTTADIEKMLPDVMTGEEQGRFAEVPEFNSARSIPGAGRFRINVYRQRGEVGMVIRSLATEIPTLTGLALPESLAEMVSFERGIVFVTGATGSGKSTTLAAMVNHRNSTRSGHIVTIEDPVEFIHPHKKGIVSQREVGIDTESYHSALKQALRQAPEVVLIGEIRDKEVASAALHFSDTGHLVLATLHSTNTSQTLERLVNFFPPDMQPQALLLLSLNLKGIVSQRLVMAKEGGRAAALEILIPTPRIRELIRTGELEGIHDSMATSGHESMQTFDQSLLSLFLDGRITEEEAFKNADSPNDLQLRIRTQDPELQALEGIHLADEPVTAAAQNSRGTRHSESE
ncbi:MAG: PilT/PilU family type 4a pilus ATPase [Planctomycetota bacterium]|nr:PilT/PilU family type 4a pilus ATPase [Planctomycetota bacterium]